MNKKKDYFKRAQNFYKKDIDGMTDKELANYIKYQFKELGIKPPKYLNNKAEIIKNKERALKRIEKQLLKKVNEKTNRKNFLTKTQQKKYNEYKKMVEDNKNLIVKELKEMGASQIMIDAYLQGNELRFRGAKLFNNLTPFTDRDLESIVTGMIKSGKSKNEFLNELLKNAKIKSKEDYAEDIFQIAQKIANINGFILNDNGKAKLMKELERVNYFGRGLLAKRLVNKLNNAYYEVYKDELDLTTADKIIEELQSDIILYNANSIKSGLTINL